METIKGKFSKTLTKEVSGECYIFPPKIEEPWPVVLWLHGGNCADRLLETASPPGFAHNGKEYPFLLLAPLCHKQHWDVLELEGLLNDIEDEFNIDKERVYVTGRSMGGTGTYTFAAHCNDRITAIAPICGRNLTAYAHKIAHMPIQIHHGKDDDIVPYSDSLQMLEQLRFNHSKNAVLVTYNGYGHGCYNPSVADSVFANIFAWFLTHTRQKPINTHKYKFL